MAIIFDTRATAACKVSLSMCTYLIVILMVVCPRSFWMTGRGVPHAACLDAKVCRRTCQPQGGMPARRQKRWRIFASAAGYLISYFENGDGGKMRRDVRGSPARILIV